MAMTFQNGGLVHDENLSVQYTKGSAVTGKANAMNSQRKNGLSGRKPLGDLSNSRKPVINQSSKRQNTKNLTFIDEENGAGKTKNIPKGSEKVQKGTRKVLSDISNFGKNINHNTICEERFLHNHQDCIKAQNCLDKDQFLSIIGLDHSKELKIATTIKPDSPLKLKEMEEFAGFDESPKKLFLFGRRGFESSPPCKSPESPSPSLDHFSFWADSNSIDFTLMKTP
ncbi:uncharacterized protein LOC101213514 [Cucumis sativus]|uniref:uncharacterized protein LOC101213514 n=1 Tax=Cucumis sativus TaxID=3659 RepID=UPI0002B4D872|nr:uncharacterized protein LOC101213514 [Cucumis sativus]KAE8650464.1 hypothetical protein Csa_011584 [Cucumis sativus]